MLRNVLWLVLCLLMIGPATANARTQIRVAFLARFVARPNESPELTSAREKIFEDKAAQENFQTLARSLRTGGSCYVCHQTGITRPHNPFGWAIERLWYEKTFNGTSLSREQVSEIFTGRDVPKKNELAEHFAAVSVEALDYWVVLNADGELELTQDAKDANGNPLTFGRRIAKGELPTTEVDGTSYKSVFPQEVLDKLMKIREEQGE